MKYQEVDNLKHLSYMQLMELNSYIENKYQISEKKDRQNNPHKYLPTPKPETYASSEKGLTKKSNHARNKKLIAKKKDPRVRVFLKTNSGMLNFGR